MVRRARFAFDDSRDPHFQPPEPHHDPYGPDEELLNAEIPHSEEDLRDMDADDDPESPLVDAA